MEINDKEIKVLILEAQKGNQESFSKIYDLFFSRIYKYIFFRTKIVEEAEDLTSLVFLKVWQHLKKYKVKKNVKFSTWLFQVAHFTLIDYYRKKRVSIPLIEIKELAAEDFTNEYVQVQEVKKYLLQLSENYQTVINLRYFQGLDYGDIGKVMGKTSLTVRVLCHRALKKMTKLMKIEND